MLLVEGVAAEVTSALHVETTLDVVKLGEVGTTQLANDIKGKRKEKKTYSSKAPLKSMAPVTVSSLGKETLESLSLRVSWKPPLTVSRLDMLRFESLELSLKTRSPVSVKLGALKDLKLSPQKPI